MTVFVGRLPDDRVAIVMVMLATMTAQAGPLPQPKVGQ
jgi:hypothetical protein